MLEFIRPNIRAMPGYIPGEQPRDSTFIKLNTNESPYPPSPRVFDAIRAALAANRLHKYPDPVGTAFRRVASKLLDVDPDGILIGNGCDDILTIITRAFVPEGGLIVSPSPSYLLHNTLAEIQAASFQTIPFTADWQLPDPWPIRRAHLTFVTNPNSPSGTMVNLDSLQRLAASLSGPVVLDEAYADFAETNSVHLVRTGKVIVTRSLSKSYCLAGMRFGYAVAEPAVVQHLLKVKDSYNCDVLSLAAATAALEDQDYAAATRAKILATRARMAQSIAELGFDVCPSQANFVWCRRKDRPVRPIYEELKRRMILVRYMNYQGYGDGLRISVGSDEEVDRLLEELRVML
jgi:histidinol-phosphate aminotransferase